MPISVSIQALLAAVGGPLVLINLISWLLNRRKKVNIKGKVALITGASSGLGKACAHVFYKHGCHVILVGRSRQTLELVKADLDGLELQNKASVVCMDLGQLDQIEAGAREALNIHGRIDILINNAGLSYRGCISDTEQAVHTQLMTVNYFGQIVLTKAILPNMIESGGGHIIAVSSIQGRFSIPYRSAYSASKHALQAYFDCLRAEVADQNISVCIVSPGYIQTSLSLNAMCGDGSSYGVTDQTTAQGLLPDKVARDILEAVQYRKDEVIPAPLMHRLVIMLRSVWPSMFFWVMAKRARKQRKQYIKQS